MSSTKSSCGVTIPSPRGLLDVLEEEEEAGGGGGGGAEAVVEVAAWTVTLLVAEVVELLRAGAVARTVAVAGAEEVGGAATPATVSVAAAAAVEAEIEPAEGFIAVRAETPAVQVVVVPAGFA